MSAMHAYFCIIREILRIPHNTCSCAQKAERRSENFYAVLGAQAVEEMTQLFCAMCVWALQS